MHPQTEGDLVPVLTSPWRCGVCSERAYALREVLNFFNPVPRCGIQGSNFCDGGIWIDIKCTVDIDIKLAADFFMARIQACSAYIDEMEILRNSAQSPAALMVIDAF